MNICRLVWIEFSAYRRYLRDASTESIIVLAVAGLIVSTADVFLAVALGWVWPSLSSLFASLSKNARVATTGAPIAAVWLAACFGADWWRARRRGDLDPYRDATD